MHAGRRLRRARPLEELIRWRLWNRTGGGLMAELGSHQLDAASIFISGLRNDGEKALPLTVSAVGGRSSFPLDRDCEDHVYCMYEFPGPELREGPEQEDRRHLFVDQRQRLRRLRRNRDGHQGHADPGARAGSDAVQRVDADDDQRHGGQGQGSGGPTLDTTQSGGGDAAVGKQALERPGQPRLHRGDRALGLVHPQSRSRRTSPAAIPRWPWATP